ncbi:MAG: cupin domain-containing protein [Planctomycetes bacterium]|nr:cupin domain-containing protein [Planctomycetota bacterium]
MTPPLIPTAHMPSELAPMPIDPAWIEEGTPMARGTVLMQSKDKLLSSGFWSCTAGKFQWVFSWDEFVHILEGEVTIHEEGGATHTLKAGDVAHFPRGLTTHWHVPKFVKKFFTLRTPEPFSL